MQNIFTNFDDKHAELFGRRTVELDHSLNTSNLFDDNALARLIENAPTNTYHVNTMDVATHDPRTRREGMIDGLSGLETLDAIKNGHIWILLQNPGNLDRRYQDLLEQVYGEIEDNVPGFRSFKQKMSILISSPKVQVYYHCDVPGQTLWQVRGRKRVYVYPNRAPFLPPENLERIVMGEAHEISLPYETWFDDHAEVVDLEPGKMLHWPLNCPHRIVNEDCLNVSFTTEHWTKELRNQYVVAYGNGVIRRTFGARELAKPEAGIGLYSRMGLAAAWKYAGFQKKRAHRFQVDFKVDPTAPNGVRSIPAFEHHR